MPRSGRPFSSKKILPFDRNHRGFPSSAPTMRHSVSISARPESASLMAAS
jgi:hypothetical protein